MISQKKQIIGGGLFLVGIVIYVFSGGDKKVKKEPAKQNDNDEVKMQAVENTGVDDIVAKNKIMQEMGSKGGKASAKARKAKKEENKNET